MTSTPPGNSARTRGSLYFFFFFLPSFTFSLIYIALPFFFFFSRTQFSLFLSLALALTILTCDISIYKVVRVYARMHAHVCKGVHSTNGWAASLVSPFPSSLCQASLTWVFILWAQPSLLYRLVFLTYKVRSSNISIHVYSICLYKYMLAYV